MQASSFHEPRRPSTAPPALSHQAQAFQGPGQAQSATSQASEIHETSALSPDMDMAQSPSQPAVLQHEDTTELSALLADMRGLWVQLEAKFQRSHTLLHELEERDAAHKKRQKIAAVDATDETAMQTIIPLPTHHSPTPPPISSGPHPPSSTSLDTASPTATSVAPATDPVSGTKRTFSEALSDDASEPASASNMPSRIACRQTPDASAAPLQQDVPSSVVQKAQRAAAATPTLQATSCTRAQPVPTSATSKVSAPSSTTASPTLPLAPTTTAVVAISTASHCSPAPPSTSSPAYIPVKIEPDDRSPRYTIAELGMYTPYELQARHARSLFAPAVKDEPGSRTSSVAPSTRPSQQSPRFPAGVHEAIATHPVLKEEQVHALKLEIPARGPSSPILAPAVLDLSTAPLPDSPPPSPSPVGPASSPLFPAATQVQIKTETEDDELAMYAVQERHDQHSPSVKDELCESLSATRMRAGGPPSPASPRFPAGVHDAELEAVSEPATHSVIKEEHSPALKRATPARGTSSPLLASASPAISTAAPAPRADSPPTPSSHAGPASSPLFPVVVNIEPANDELATYTPQGLQARHPLTVEGELWTTTSIGGPRPSASPATSPSPVGPTSLRFLPAATQVQVKIEPSDDEQVMYALQELQAQHPPSVEDEHSSSSSAATVPALAVLPRFPTGLHGAQRDVQTNDASAAVEPPTPAAGVAMPTPVRMAHILVKTEPDTVAGLQPAAIVASPQVATTEDAQTEVKIEAQTVVSIRAATQVVYASALVGEPSSPDSPAPLFASPVEDSQMQVNAPSPVGEPVAPAPPSPTSPPLLDPPGDGSPSQLDNIPRLAAAEPAPRLHDQLRVAASPSPPSNDEEQTPAPRARAFKAIITTTPAPAPSNASDASEFTEQAAFPRRSHPTPPPSRTTPPPPSTLANPDEAQHRLPALELRMQQPPPSSLAPGRLSLQSRISDGPLVNERPLLSRLSSPPLQLRIGRRTRDVDEESGEDVRLRKRRRRGGRW